MDDSVRTFEQPLTTSNDSVINKITDEEAARMGSRMAVGAKGNGRIHLRKAAGNVWNDPTLDDWPQNDFRIFCGDLGNEVTDEVLANAFKKYPSFQRARVIRDRNSGKSKGYGFVSMMSPEDMLAALNEMNHKFVGNRPIRVMRSKWKDRDIGSAKNRQTAALYQMSADNSKTLRKFKKLGKTVTGGKKPIWCMSQKPLSGTRFILAPEWQIDSTTDPVSLMITC